MSTNIRICRDWTEGEDTLLFESKMTDSEIAKKLNRTKDSVKSRRKRLRAKARKEAENK